MFAELAHDLARSKTVQDGVRSIGVVQQTLSACVENNSDLDMQAVWLDLEQPSDEMHVQWETIASGS